MSTRFYDRQQVLFVHSVHALDTGMKRGVESSHLYFPTSVFSNYIFFCTSVLLNLTKNIFIKTSQYTNIDILIWLHWNQTGQVFYTHNIVCLVSVCHVQFTCNVKRYPTYRHEASIICFRKMQAKCIRNIHVSVSWCQQSDEPALKIAQAKL